MRLHAALLAACLLLGSCAPAGRSSTTRASSGSPSPIAAPDAPAEPTYATSAPDFEARDVERAVHRAINHARTRRDRAPLAWSDSLHRLARSHSREMAERDFFAHVNPDGESPVERAQRFGFPTARSLGDGRRIGVSENLFRTYRYDGYRDVYRQRGDGPRRHIRREYDWKTVQALAQQTVQGWLESPPHRHALLSPDFRQHGLGVVFTSKRVYVTQNLF